jgi:hypothetical protein
VVPRRPTVSLETEALTSTGLSLCQVGVVAPTSDATAQATGPPLVKTTTVSPDPTASDVRRNAPATRSVNAAVHAVHVEQLHVVELVPAGVRGEVEVPAGSPGGRLGGLPVTAQGARDQPVGPHPGLGQPGAEHLALLRAELRELVVVGRPPRRLPVADQQDHSHPRILATRCSATWTTGPKILNTSLLVSPWNQR